MQLKNTTKSGRTPPLCDYFDNLKLSCKVLSSAFLLLQEACVPLQTAAKLVQDQTSLSLQFPWQALDK